MSLSFLVAMSQYIVDHSATMSLAQLVRWTNVLDQIASIYHVTPTI